MSENNYAFIDSQNVYLNTASSGWKIDFLRFRIYLREKYKVEKAFMFMGYIESNTKLYDALKRAGFICIFKPTLFHKNGVIKGNCDAELVLQAMIEYSNYDKAIIVTGDGDFYCLVTYLIDNRKLYALMIPNRTRYSYLLKTNTIKPFLRFMDYIKDKIGNDGSQEIKKEKIH